MVSKEYRFSTPNTIWTVLIHSIIRTLVYRFHNIMRQVWCIQRQGIVLTLPLIVPTATERSENATSLCSPAKVHITTPARSISKAPEMQTPP